MFKDLRISTRLAIGIGSVLMLTVLAIAAGLFEVATVAEQNRQLLDEPLTKERITSDWYRVIDSGSKRTLAMAVSADPVLPATFADDMKSSTALSSKYQDELTRLATSAEERQRMADILAARKVYLNLRNEIVALRRDGKGDEANAAAERLKPAALFDALRQHLRKDIPVIETDAAINDPAFADAAVAAFREIAS